MQYLPRWKEKPHEQARQQLTTPKARHGNVAIPSAQVWHDSACMDQQDKQETRRNIMSNYLEDRKEARKLVIEKYTKNGCYLIGHEDGDLYCADNYNHLLELHKNYFNDEPLVLLAINEDDAKELQDDWKLDNEGIPCPAIKMIGKDGVPA